jgi:hypothetical protein
MPRMQPVVRTRDLLSTQQRITAFLACNHVVSITEREIRSSHVLAPINFLQASELMCPHCPDPEPEPVKREEMSPRQLWRDAGEPIP